MRIIGYVMIFASSFFIGSNLPTIKSQEDAMLLLALAIVTAVVVWQMSKPCR